MSDLPLDIAALDNVALHDLTGDCARSTVVLTINNRLSRSVMASLVENIREPGQVLETRQSRHAAIGDLRLREVQPGQSPQPRQS